MSNERKELSNLIASQHTAAAVEAIIKAGYRKPRTIATASGLFALPDKTVFLDKHEYGMVMHPILRGDTEYADAVLPITVLWEPNP